MKTISIINLKGGVAKTLTADNMAHVLAVFHNKRVLLVDNDKQGNTSKAFGVHSYDEKSLSDILTARRIDPHEVIKKTRFQNIDVLPANMTLIRANLEVMMDSTRPQQTRLRAALGAVTGEYDYCIIDNAPDINISTINALVASDDVIIPIKIDKYAFDGLAELKEQIEDTRDDLNPRLRLAGCLKAMRRGEVHRLVIGPKAYGTNKWVITKLSNSLNRYDNRGNLLVAKVSVTMKSYSGR